MGPQLRLDRPLLVIAAVGLGHRQQGDQLIWEGRISGVAITTETLLPGRKRHVSNRRKFFFEARNAALKRTDLCLVFFGWQFKQWWCHANT